MPSANQLVIYFQVSMAICCIVITGYVALPYKLGFPPNLSGGDRLVFAFRCLSFSALPLFFCVNKVGSQRFANMETLGAHPTAPVAPSMTTFVTYQRILQNTLEQTLLHVLAVLGMASCLEVDRLQLVPLLVLLFVVGRTFFFVGYVVKPVLRGFGFSMTFIPSVLGILYSVHNVAWQVYNGQKTP
ncbi:transmembrane protein 79-like [Diadema setosum]|uniref:transmembrane protein 79-like n=1 Tax=Diadema setosum TaxID=31175 RepID=UPI003B3AFC1B